MNDCPQTLDDPDGFSHECIYDEGHDGMHECVCHLMWDDINPQRDEAQTSRQGSDGS